MEASKFQIINGLVNNMKYIYPKFKKINLIFKFFNIYGIILTVKG